MQENFDLKYLRPIKGKHAISEVIFSVFLASPIINPSRYEALVKDNGKLSKSFQNFRILTGLRVQMKINPNETETLSETGVSKTGTDGFNIEKYKDGKLSWVISYQPSETPTLAQNLLKIHCVDYEGWSSFFAEVVNLLDAISDFEDLFIRGYSLYYLDQFSWTQKSLPDMSYIFKKGNLYLSDLFFGTKGVWNFASNTNRTISQKIFSENINIGVKYVEENNYLIYVFHNSATMIDEFKSLKQLTQDKDLKIFADEMHTLNKDFLGQTLTDDIQILIGIKKINMFPAFQVPVINAIPYSVSQSIEKKHFLKVGDVLNIEELLKKNVKSFITFENKTYSPFSNRINRLLGLKNNWDNYGADAPNPEIIRKVATFLEILPKKYSQLLEAENIFPNPHGTITVEWRNDEYVISIEFGLRNSSFYSILNNNKDFDENLESILSSKKLINALNKIIA